MPFFSVIIPLYNKEEQIEKTLQSVLNQTFQDFEVIIINDGSTDNSLEKIENIKDSRLSIYSQKNCGAAIARNTGVEKANSEYIALIDADDFWFPNHLEEHQKSIIQFPNCNLYSNAYKLKLAENKFIDAIYSTPQENNPHIIKNYFKASTIHPIAMTSSITIKKGDFNDLGGYNPKIRSGQDLDLMIRFGIHKTVVFNPQITCYYDKTVVNSLSKENHQISKRELFNSFKKYEKKDSALRKYLSLNRYSLAIQCKFSSNKDTFKKLLPEIDKNHLNIKQKILLVMPRSILKIKKRIHLILIKMGLYISSYK